MKLTTQLKTEITDVYEAFWGALFYADMDRYSVLLDEHYRLIGTTEQEFFFSKAEAVRFLKQTADQLAGNLERRNSRQKLELIENLVLITEQFDAYVLIKDRWSFYEKTRVTTLLQEKQEGWKIIQQHFSFPDTKAGNGQTIGLEQVTKENLQLKEAIRRRTIELELKNKELEIEFSLERVRAVAMGMKQPVDMLEVCEVITRELISLGIGNIRNIQTAVIDNEKETYQNYEYYQVAREKLVTTVAYKEHPVIHAFVKRMVKDPEGFYARTMKGEGLKKWLKYQAKSGQFLDPASKKAASLHYYFYSIGSGALGITTYAPLSKEAIGLFKRFRNVFQLAYARFVDIQQAEAQAREAQIEAALERVRSRSIGMQKSEDLKDVIKVVYDQLVHLNIKLDHAGFVVDYQPKADWHFWITDNQEIPSKITHPYFESVWATQFNNAKEKGEELFITCLNFEEKNRFYNELLSYVPGLPQDSKDFYLNCPALAASTVLLENVGLYIENFEGVPYSVDENIILMRFGKVFQQTYTRFLDLQKAEDQTREAQVEVAVERVRAQSMAMHKASDLVRVNEELLLQLSRLNITGLTGVSFYLVDEAGIVKVWDLSSPGNMSDANNYAFSYDPEKYPILGEFVGIWKAAEQDYFILDYPKEKLIQAVEELQHIAPDVAGHFRHAIESGALSHQWNPAGRLTNGILSIDLMQPPSADIKNIVLKMAGAFNLAYQRFLDLQKAEAQAREAQIETALEKVRSRSMAMHSSAELKEVIAVVFDRLKELGLHFEGTGIQLFNQGSRDSVLFVAAPNQISAPELIDLPYDEEDFSASELIRDIWMAREKKEHIFNNEYSFEEKNRYFRYVARHNSGQVIPPAVRQMQEEAPGYTASIAMESNSALWVDSWSGQKITTEEFDVVKRAAQVFEQTYIRFLDLKRAEAQAREAQVEAALEKVRSRTMAMQSSNELQETAAVLFQEFKKLGAADMQQVTIGIYNEEERVIDFRVTSWANNGEQENRAFRLDMDEPNLVQPAITAWKAGKKSAVFDLTGEALQGWLNYRNKISGITISSNDTGGRRVISAAYFSKGHLTISSPLPLPEETIRILERFAAVFDGTYTRFLDLEKAEAQVREAQIEAALERVRSRTLAMQRSDELAETAAVLFQQLIALGIEPNRLYISIINSEQGETEFWITDEEGRKVSTAFTAKMQENTTFLKMYEGWKQQQKSLVIDMQGEELQNYFRHLTGLGVSFKGGLEQKRRIQEIAYFSNGFIGMASPEEQPAETLELLERFAAVFNLTFTRFNDLKMAEAHARQAEQDLIAIKEAKLKAEEALSVLQATQKQLVQSEKMASLGELTAGIAHEIQNPLNFVNNFSEVSKELLDEMREAIEKGDAEEAKEIMNDVIQNLEKINHHGKRADGIVKGMLQHSRSSSGVKEPTDINALADEYLRLAYHGLRAKDKSFNATLNTEYDETIDTIDIIPQDIGRVILNLITNAFYACTERSRSTAPLPPKGGFSDPNYRHAPTIWVSTKKERDTVIISVRDNGPGIPEEIRDKIFQPFFTTKPTGQGTGLGLSLSYDIVKAHGGELRVETKEGEGSSFILELPIV